MKAKPKISIILPARNAEKYIQPAIESVLAQDYQNWELLVVDNDSTDQTAQIARQFSDGRIRILFEEKHTVAYARNRGLENMSGAFFCFLDADDLLPKYSLSSRLSIFQNKPNAKFVDGKVTFENKDFSKVVRTFNPDFEGVGLQQKILTQTESCFMGMSWMFRRDDNKSYHFDSRISHCEDLLFCLQQSREGAYFYTEENIYRYRQHTASLMHDLPNLEQGYRHVCHWTYQNLGEDAANAFSAKCKATMVKSYLKAGKIKASTQLYWSQFP